MNLDLLKEVLVVLILVVLLLILLQYAGANL